MIWVRNRWDDFGYMLHHPGENDHPGFDKPPVAANQLAAGAFFSVKMAPRDLTSPVAANQLAAGASFR